MGVPVEDLVDERGGVVVGKWRITSVGDMDTRVDDLGVRTEVTCVTKARGGKKSVWRGSFSKS